MSKRKRRSKQTKLSSTATAATEFTPVWTWLLGVVAIGAALLMGLASRHHNDSTAARPEAESSVRDVQARPQPHAAAASQPSSQRPVQSTALVRVDRSQGAPMQYYARMELNEQPRIIQWFGGIPAELRAARVDGMGQSNIRRVDYVGADRCKDCHAKNYKHWANNPHRWMNAWASEDTVRGDFSGEASMRYMGGVGSFYRDGEEYHMRLSRDGIEREYQITRTIGSRFFQYYLGQLVKGPEPIDHIARSEDHVLPFGYWFENQQWVPIVNIEEESPDAQRVDPFSKAAHVHYDRSCSECHTTKPTGDTMLGLKMMDRIDSYAPRVMHFAAEAYLRETHPEVLTPLSAHFELTNKQILQTLSNVKSLPVKDHAVQLGIACEACHNGCKEHADHEEQLPSFFPESPHVVILGDDPKTAYGRTSLNVNWVCSRCHAGNRVRYAAGISTWNSTEFSDAALGRCFNPLAAHNANMSQLTCVHCHDPHIPIGDNWTRTAAEDDARCLQCHEVYRDQATRAAHTHHPTGSRGDACLNCHMPRINEGLQDLVRTHTIYSPTDRKMLEANHPNACNICHVQEPIDWTLGYLKEWYGTDNLSAAAISTNYPHRSGPVAIGWLKSPHHGTRLVGSDALTRADAKWAIDDIINVLDDPYLINRQFTARGLQKMLGVDVRDFGYQFYMFKAERAEPLTRIRESMVTEPTD